MSASIYLLLRTTNVEIKINVFDVKQIFKMEAFCLLPYYWSISRANTCKKTRNDNEWIPNT